MSPSSIHPHLCPHLCTPSPRPRRPHTQAAGLWVLGPLGPLLDLDLGRLNQSSVRRLVLYPPQCARRLRPAEHGNAEHEGKLVRMLAVDMSAWTAWLRRRLRRRPRHRNERDGKKKKGTAAVLCFCRVVGARVRHLRWPCQTNIDREREMETGKRHSRLIVSESVHGRMDDVDVSTPWGPFHHTRVPAMTSGLFFSLFLTLTLTLTLLLCHPLPPAWPVPSLYTYLSPSVQLLSLARRISLYGAEKVSLSF